MRAPSPPSPRSIRGDRAEPLFDSAGTRRIEQAALAQAAPHALMQRAGLAVARLALALAPHARSIWVAAGPGNNGGDGLEAAAQLQRRGKPVALSWLGSPESASADTRASLQHAREAGVRFVEAPPPDADFGIDALLGIGSNRAPSGRMAQWMAHMGASGLPVLAVDNPTGLDPDTGVAADIHVHAVATLCLLTLKPGLFTAQGRDASGAVWLDGLQTAPALLAGNQPSAWLSGPPPATARAHASHKGSYGDVVVVGGATGMAGAAWLAGSAALHAGAGRVYVCALDAQAAAAGGLLQPELMSRTLVDAPLDHAAVVCGCGGGSAVREVLPSVLARAEALVLDAEALNAIAGDPQLATLLRRRATRGRRTVLTPHPLEAARLLGGDTRHVQQDRLRAARTLADTHDCVVLLKGSGTVIAAPGRTPHINPTGNARLATAGSGDVLAGAIGAALAGGAPAFDAAVRMAWLHGAAADRWPAHQALTASALARSLLAPPSA